MSKPRILLFDLETSHNIMAAFDLYSPNQFYNILQESYIISASWKWLGESRVYSNSVLNHPEIFKKSPNDDFGVVQKLHEVVSSADAVVGHYSDKFDCRKLNARVVYHGLSPLPPIVQMDTYKFAKAKFKFNCNKLDYLGQFLGIGRKISTEPGLWLRCLRGERGAIKQMVKYNRQDVVLLEKVFLKLRPFLPAKLDSKLFSTNAGTFCPDCGSENVQSRGKRYTKTRVIDRHQCIDCRRWF